MASAVARTAPQPPPLPHSPPKRVKKKVRLQEVIMDEQLTKPVDTFHVKISDVRAVLRVAEPRPVLLTFEFDNYWYAETDVWAENVQPLWKFNAASMRGHDGRKPVSAHGDDTGPVRRIVPDAKFIYDTEFGYKLHRKFLIVKLAERSPYGDVEWGQGILPLDSIARGCPATNISIIATDGLTCYGNVTCNITMANVQTVRAHLTDIKLSDYPEAYNYDVKLIYLEFGYQGFEDGYKTCTEKRSDGEPRFSAQPALEFDTTLQDMLAYSDPRSRLRSLKLYFSVHRQVARTRTEEIGVGALPIRMLFSKVREGWMDLPTKFKVPLANYKGIIRGKILLRNIPQFSQLPGNDLVNLDGNILPLDEDLTTRKIQPWVKLPKSREQKKQPNGTMARGLGQKETDPLGISTPSSHAQVATTASPKMNGNAYVPSARYYSSVTESASDGGSESSGGSPRGRQSNRVDTNHTSAYYETDNLRGSHLQTQYPTVEPKQVQRSPTSPSTVRDQINWKQVEVAYGASGETAGENLSGHRNASRNRTGRSVKTVSKIDWAGRMSKGEEICKEPEVVQEEAGDHEWDGRNEEDETEQWRDRFVGLRISEDAGERRKETNQREVNGAYENTVKSDTANECSEHLEVLRERRNKSGKSIESMGTADAGVEIGSVVLSTASDEGYATGSRTTTDDVLIVSQRLSTGPPSEERYDVEDVETGMGEIGQGEMLMGKEVEDKGVEFDQKDESGQDLYDDEEDEGDWTAILDQSSGQYFFAHKYTQESLWLPPEWERMEDEDGREYFVDHGKRETQREFPAAEARVYRESVYTGR